MLVEISEVGPRDGATKNVQGRSFVIHTTRKVDGETMKVSDYYKDSGRKSELSGLPVFVPDKQTIGAVT